MAASLINILLVKIMDSAKTSQNSTTPKPLASDPKITSETVTPTNQTVSEPLTPSESFSWDQQTILIAVGVAVLFIIIFAGLYKSAVQKAKMKARTMIDIQYNPELSIVFSKDPSDQNPTSARNSGTIHARPRGRAPTPPPRNVSH